MEYIASSKEMMDIDRYTIDEIGISSLVLMERASLAVVEKIEQLIEKIDRILIVVEGGNNGGDGLAVARILHERGYLVDVFYIKNVHNASPQFEIQLGIIEKLMVPVYDKMPRKEYSIVVDGIFGVGLSKNITGEHERVINNLNTMDVIRVAIDMPSGIDATTGRILGCAFRADYTVTFGLKKLGLLLLDGVDYSGEITVADIGFPEKAIKEVSPQYYSYGKEDLTKLPKRLHNSNKGTYGHVAVIAGSKNIAGAAFFAAKAAYVSGAGLVKVYTHEANRSVIQTILPEAIVDTYDEYTNAIKCVENALEWANVIVIGPGMGTNPTSKRMLNDLLADSTVPIIVDADGLNVLAEEMDLLKESNSQIVLTPHMKEMSRLVKKDIEEIVDNRFEITSSLCEEYKVNCILKDARSIVPDTRGKAYINISGNNGMSTGGSGDVLTGVIAAFIAGGLEVEEATRLGAYVHGLAGDIAKTRKGEYGLLATDIIDSIPTVLC